MKADKFRINVEKRTKDEKKQAHMHVEHLSAVHQTVDYIYISISIFIFISISISLKSSFARRFRVVLK